ncbi:MAG: murein L,D-transpeptidase catalytic domain family protein [Desulfobacterales bacterium]|nr:murein L,D-transpeptidase catalytic domain family protein [Desulfobacterales bacterium]MCP4159748.1 murein L,D-transpeptidase catalytic domain family protein [Deltaproteobacteria bacterium]
MKNIIFNSAVMRTFLSLVLIFFLFYGCGSDYRKEKIPPLTPESEIEIKAIYSESKLSGKLKYNIFRRAVAGQKNIKLKNREILTIIDFTKSSSKKRIFVIDLKKRKVLFITFVAHGRNSGGKFAKVFSNKRNSKMSSLGFYITSETYNGKHGYSLRLDGIEKNINNLARKRAIVIHGASYANYEFIKKIGRLGRSWGCPALPLKLSKQIIDTIKEGSCLYIHGNDKLYSEESFYVEKKIKS